MPSLIESIRSKFGSGINAPTPPKETNGRNVAHRHNVSNNQSNGVTKSNTVECLMIDKNIQQQHGVSQQVVDRIELLKQMNRNWDTQSQPNRIYSNIQDIRNNNNAIISLKQSRQLTPILNRNNVVTKREFLRAQQIQKYRVRFRDANQRQPATMSGSDADSESMLDDFNTDNNNGYRSDGEIALINNRIYNDSHEEFMANGRRVYNHL
jgi:hypothetical protein